MHITDDNQVKILVKFIHDINQHLKNIYGSKGHYNYENGVIFCNGKGQISPYVNVLPKYTKRNQELKDIIDNVSFTIFGKEFFQFHKNYKNNITEIVIEDKYIHFKTDLPLVELIFEKTHEELFLPTDVQFEEMGEFNLEEDYTRLINELGNNPFTIYLDFNTGGMTINEEPQESFLQLNYNKKFLVGFKCTKTLLSKISITVYDFDSDKNLYLLELIVDSKEITTKQYMVITDVIID